MSKTLAVGSPKGGVGKTTAAVTLATLTGDIDRTFDTGQFLGWWWPGCPSSQSSYSVILGA